MCGTPIAKRTVIIAAVVTIIVVLLLIVLVVICIVWKCRRRKHTPESSHSKFIGVLILFVHVLSAHLHNAVGVSEKTTTVDGEIELTEYKWVLYTVHNDDNYYYAITSLSSILHRV